MQGQTGKAEAKKPVSPAIGRDTSKATHVTFGKIIDVAKTASLGGNYNTGFQMGEWFAGSRVGKWLLGL
jgi:hypothetical protein